MGIVDSGCQFANGQGVIQLLVHFNEPGDHVRQYRVPVLVHDFFIGVEIVNDVPEPEQGQEADFLRWTAGILRVCFSAGKDDARSLLILCQGVWALTVAADHIEKQAGHG